MEAMIPKHIETQRIGKKCGIFGVLVFEGKRVEQEDPRELGRIGIKTNRHRGKGAGYSVNMQPPVRAERTKQILGFSDNGNYTPGLLEKDIKFPKKDEFRNFIGHTRWSTQGDKSHRQPFEAKDWIFNFIYIFNGNISNYPQLKEEYKNKGHQFKTDNDTEIFEAIIRTEWKDGDSIASVLKRNLHKLEGAFCLLINTGEEMVLARDARATHPYYYLKTENQFMAFSETYTATELGYDAKDCIEVKPGEILTVTTSGFDESRCYEIDYPSGKPERRPCMFEQNYFQRHKSQDFMNPHINRSVFEVRFLIGQLIAKHILLDQYIEELKGKKITVTDIPNSGKFYGTGIAYDLIKQLGADFVFNKGSDIKHIKEVIPEEYLEYFVEPKTIFEKIDPDDDRSYISETLEEAIEVVGRKRIMHSQNIDTDSDILIVVDDSTIKGTTLEQNVRAIRPHFNGKIWAVMGIPPVIDTCTRGVVIDKENLVYPAGNYDNNSTAKLVGLNPETGDKLIFVTPEILYEAYGVRKVCMECLGIRN